MNISPQFSHQTVHTHTHMHAYTRARDNANGGRSRKDDDVDATPNGYTQLCVVMIISTVASSRDVAG